MCKLFKKIWHSPTFTTWGSYLVQSLRLLLITPLILTRFNETEIAAWFLFAALNFFGETVSQRLGLSFSRMFAFAMGGSSNLAPIKEKRTQENQGKPNWLVFERAYGTIGIINLGVGWLNVLIACAMGWFGLSNLLEGYEAKGVIWLAFALMQLTSLLGFIYQRYAVALRGMNYIALVNRWNIAFSLISLAAGILTLWLGGGMIMLVIVMQSFVLIGVLRSRFLLKQVEGGRVSRFKAYAFDSEVFKWGWEPTWKGMLTSFADLGVVQLGGIAFARVGSASDVASYLLSIRLAQTVVQISGAPFNSLQPLFGRLLASGETEKLRKLYFQRAAYSLLLMGLGLSVIILTGDWLLQIIGSQVGLISQTNLLLLGALILHKWFINYQGAICGAANNILMIRSSIISLMITLALLFLMPTYGITFYLLACWLPRIIIFNVRPGMLGAHLLNLTPLKFNLRIYMYALISCASLLLSYLITRQFS